jgi:hypothetical protein
VVANGFGFICGLTVARTSAADRCVRLPFTSPRLSLKRWVCPLPSAGSNPQLAWMRPLRSSVAGTALAFQSRISSLKTLSVIRVVDSTAIRSATHLKSAPAHKRETDALVRRDQAKSSQIKVFPRLSIRNRNPAERGQKILAKVVVLPLVYGWHDLAGGRYPWTRRCTTGPLLRHYCTLRSSVID